MEDENFNRYAMTSRATLNEAGGVLNACAISSWNKNVQGSLLCSLQAWVKPFCQLSLPGMIGAGRDNWGRRGKVERWLCSSSLTLADVCKTFLSLQNWVTGRTNKKEIMVTSVKQQKLRFMSLMNASSKKSLEDPLPWPNCLSFGSACSTHQPPKALCVCVWRCG